MTRAPARRSAGLLAAAVLAAAVTALPARATSPHRAYTPAGNAAAKAIVLRLSDLPAGWKIDSTGGGSGGAVTCKSFDPDQSDLTSVGHAAAGFARKDGPGNVASLAGVFTSPAQARTSWNRIVRPGMLACLSSLFTQGGNTKSTRTTVVSKRKLALPLPGGRKAAFRIVADVATNGQHVKVYLDLILQGGGAADTVMVITSVLDPPSAALEAKLAAAIAGRLPR